MNQIIKAGALVCALAMLEWNPAAVAEEKRLGDYIYVPAMSDPAGMGTNSLRVEGVKSGENGEKETEEALAGAGGGIGGPTNRDVVDINLNVGNEKVSLFAERQQAAKFVKALKSMESGS